MAGVLWLVALVAFLAGFVQLMRRKLWWALALWAAAVLIGPGATRLIS